MDSQIIIKGVCPVLSVPFDSSGEVDYRSFRNLCQWIIGLNIKSVLFFGVASENMKLNDDERLLLLEILLEERKNHNLKVITTVADHSSELAIKRAKLYKNMGADCINILPPSFLSPSLEQINFHLEAVLREVDIPVMIQHLPQAGGMKEISDVLKLANKYSNLAIIKCEENPPSESIRTVNKMTNGKVRTLIGWGGVYWKEGILAGTDGLQPGCGLTDLYLWAQDALERDDFEEFERRIKKFIPNIAKWISDLELLIAVEKDILYQRGIIETNYCRHPTSKIDSATSFEIQEMLKFLKVFKS